MSIQLILFDLDGTLLTGDKQLSPANRVALEKAAAAGIHLVPCTGRFYSAIPQVVRDLPFLRYFVTVNGAQVYDRQVDQILLRREISPADAQAVYDKLDTLPLIYDCYWEDRAFMSAGHLAQAEAFVQDPHLLALVKGLREPLADFRGTMAGRGAQKIQAFFPTPEQRQAAARDLMWSFPHMALTSSYPCNLEINSREATKGAALEFLAQRLGIPLRDTMAFGDGSNDLSMLQAAGLGVAMQNADPALKAVAKYVAASNDEDGVARTLEHFCIHPLDSEPAYEDPNAKQKASPLGKLREIMGR